MFGIGDKVLPRSHGRRRHAIWYWMAFWFIFCIGALLGVNIALLIFASTSVVLLNLLSGFSAGAALSYAVSLGISALLAAAFLIGYMWTFGGASNTYEAAKAYEHEYGVSWWWPRLLVVGLEVFFIALDLISLSYRREFFAAKGADQLFWFFVALSLLSPIVGLLMHILENKPLSHRLAEIRQYNANLVGDDIEAAIRAMPTDKRTRLLFDPDGETVLAEHFQEEQERQLREQERRQAETSNRRERQKQAHRPLVSGSLSQQAGQTDPHQQSLSRLNGLNGRSRQ